MAEETIHIVQKFNVNAEKVWLFLNDHNRWNEIFPIEIKRVKDSKDDQNINGVGSVRRLGLPIINLEETIAKSERGQLIEYTITKGPLIKNHYGIMQFIDNNDGTSILNYTIVMESNIAVLGSLISNSLRLAIKDALKKLVKRFDENPNYA